MDVPSYEFGDFCHQLLPFLTQQDLTFDDLVSDYQLIKRISDKFYNRLKGRFPELQEYLYSAKIAYFEKVVHEEKEDLRKVQFIEGGETEETSTPTTVDTVTQGVAEITIELKRVDWTFNPKQLKVIKKDMEAYLKEVEEENEKLQLSITETIKSLKETFKLDPKLKDTIIIKVGSVDLGTQYSISKMDHVLDIVVYNDALPKPVDL